MWPNPPFPENLVTFTEEILNGKLHFLCSVCPCILSNPHILSLISISLYTRILASSYPRIHVCFLIFIFLFNNNKVNCLWVFYLYESQSSKYVLYTWQEHLESFHCLILCLNLKGATFSFSQVVGAIIVVLCMLKFQVLNTRSLATNYWDPLDFIFYMGYFWA